MNPQMNIASWNETHRESLKNSTEIKYTYCYMPKLPVVWHFGDRAAWRDQASKEMQNVKEITNLIEK